MQPVQQSSGGQNEAVKTAVDVNTALKSTYSLAGQADLYGGGIFLYPDLVATENSIDLQGTSQDVLQMAAQNLLGTNAAIKNLWQDGYQVINQANIVLANINMLPAADQNSAKGQAEFFRGLVYFDLVKLFGKSWNDGNPNANPGVPLLLTLVADVSVAAAASRATVAQVYQQAVTDLTDAENILPGGNACSANKYAAAAILARLYLQKGDYKNAANEANKVISSNAYELVRFLQEFPSGKTTAAVQMDNTNEDIFSMPVSSQQGVNYLNTFYAPAAYYGKGHISLKWDFLDNYKPGDSRLSGYSLDKDGILRTDKFDNSYGNVHIARLGEMYLIRAEANFRLSSSIGATPLDDINIIRDRADIPLLSGVTLNDILAERVRELDFEGGFFFHDAKRLQQTIGALPYNSPKLVFPIPQ